jgi:predicted dehydrogenase
MVLRPAGGAGIPELRPARGDLPFTLLIQDGDPMPKKLKIAVVGLGRIGWVFHFKQAQQSPLFDLVAAVDPLEERLQEAREAAGCRTYRTYEALWKHEHPDVVAIATPTKLHEAMTRRALREGSHVILEKPMTTSTASADRMIRESERQGRRIFVYQPHRLTPETRTAREIIDSGVLGPIYLIRRMACRYMRRNDWQSLRKNAGGMLNNYGAHYLDQVRFLSDGTPIADVRCHLWAAATIGDADDVVKAWVKTEKGQLLEVEINQATPHAAPPWHVCGKYGSMVQGEGGFHLKYYDPKKAPRLKVVEGAAPDRKYFLGDEIPWREKVVPILPGKQLDFYRNVHEAITRNRKPYIRSEESRELMWILERCRKASKF